MGDKIRELEKEAMALAEEKRIKDEVAQKLKENEKKQAIAEALGEQLVQLKEKNQKFKDLEKEKEAMILSENKLQELEEARQTLIRKREAQKHAKMLWRQWKAQLRQRTLERQKELLADKELLEKLVGDTARDQTARTEKKRKNAFRN